MSKTILVVDDKSNVRSAIEEYLTNHGFRVVTADNGRTALYTARHEKPDLILLDIMMPEMDGYQFLQLFRREKDTPIIVLTAKQEEMDKVLGLELGADDYITKPFGMNELVARIRTVLRRVNNHSSTPEVIRVSDVYLDRERYEVRVGEHVAQVSPTEFELLAILMSSPGRICTREELVDKMPKTTISNSLRTVDVHIHNLRKKIELDASNPKYIKTVHGVGYIFQKKGNDS